MWSSQYCAQYTWWNLSRPLIIAVMQWTNLHKIILALYKQQLLSIPYYLWIVSPLIHIYLISSIHIPQLLCDPCWIKDPDFWLLALYLTNYDAVSIWFVCEDTINTNRQYRQRFAVHIDAKCGAHWKIENCLLFLHNAEIIANQCN